MNKERLLKLADFVEANATDNRFDMTTFFSSGVINLEDLHNKCGTTACLAGWGCLIPEFNQAGYHAEIYDVTNPESGIIPVYMGKKMFEALEDFFDISYTATHYLFGEYSDQEETISREDEGVEIAVARIRDFVAAHSMKWEEPEEENKS